MDVNTVLRYFEERKLLYSSYHGDLLLQSLNVNEFVYREERRSDLFLKRIDYVCMSENLKVAMVRETACKQLKRYLKTYHGMDNTHAQRFADKINLGSRIYRRFTTIVGNFSRCPDLDIRDHTIKELSLAVHLSWLIRRNALIKTKKKVPVDAPIVVDEQSFQQSVEDIFNSRWYKDARDNPTLVASILNRISDLVVSTSLYKSQK